MQTVKVALPAFSPRSPVVTQIVLVWPSKAPSRSVRSSTLPNGPEILPAFGSRSNLPARSRFLRHHQVQQSSLRRVQVRKILNSVVRCLPFLIGCQLCRRPALFHFAVVAGGVRSHVLTFSPQRSVLSPHDHITVKVAFDLEFVILPD